ncbi:MAG: ParM/StbA family protein [Desulforudis sp.]|nr:MAG: ParM/StbA family protein [Desulforudis sp.]
MNTPIVYSRKTIAVDVGYSHVKAMSDGGAKASFPSVVAPGDESPLNGLFGRGVEHRVSVRPFFSQKESARRHLVGEAALRVLSATATLSREKPPEIHDVLLLTAAYLLGADCAELAAGLPLAYYASQRDALRRRLEELSAWVSVGDGPERHITFSRVVVIPQGVGAAFAANVNLPANGYVGLLDIGCYTTDYLLFEPRSGSLVPLPGAHGSFELGTHLVQRALAEAYQARTGAPLPPRRYGEVLFAAANGKSVLYRGRPVELVDVLEEARERVARQIARTVAAEWGDRVDNLAVVTLTGGGALIFGDVLKQELGAVETVSDPVYANAAGFLRMLQGAGTVKGAVRTTKTQET